MKNGLRVFGLALVTGLVGCVAEEQPDEAVVVKPSDEAQMVTPQKAPKEILVVGSKLTADADDDAARMPNIRNPDLTK